VKQVGDSQPRQRQSFKASMPVLVTFSIFLMLENDVAEAPFLGGFAQLLREMLLSSSAIPGPC
jgi:hypothetical protein